MTSLPFTDQYIQGNGQFPAPDLIHLFFKQESHDCSRFRKKNGTSAGFEPQACQIRGNINQPALHDLLQRTMLMNRIQKIHWEIKDLVGASINYQRCMLQWCRWDKYMKIKVWNRISNCLFFQLIFLLNFPTTFEPFIIHFTQVTVDNSTPSQRLCYQ